MGEREYGAAGPGGERRSTVMPPGRRRLREARAAAEGWDAERRAAEGLTVESTRVPVSTGRGEYRSGGRRGGIPATEAERRAAVSRLAEDAKEREQRAEMQAQAAADATRWVAKVVRQAEEKAERQARKKSEKRARAERTRDVARGGLFMLPDNGTAISPAVPYRRAAVLSPERRSEPKVTVRSEPRVYDDPANSWLLDVLSLKMASWGGLGALGGGLPIPSRSERSAGHSWMDARERLMRYEAELAYEVTQCSDEGMRVRRTVSEQHRRWHGTAYDRSGDDLRGLLINHLAPELRDSGTGSGSLGSFTPTQYIVNEFVRWRTNHSAVASFSGKFDLPASGMEIDVPVMASGIAMTDQGGDNQAIATSSPTASFLKVPVKTVAGSTPNVSQQLIDRIGPGLSYDRFFAQQAALQAATEIDLLVINAITAVASTITDNSANSQPMPFFGDVAKAAAQITAADGTVLPADCLFVPTATMKWLQSILGNDQRPVWMPTAGGTAGRTGKVGTPEELYTGYDVFGAMAIEDNNLPTTNTGADATLLVGNFAEGCWVGTSELIVDIFPEWDPTALSAVARGRQYVAVAVTYPNAFVQITGSAYPAAPSFG